MAAWEHLNRILHRTSTGTKDGRAVLFLHAPAYERESLSTQSAAPAANPVVDFTVDLDGRKPAVNRRSRTRTC